MNSAITVSEPGAYEAKFRLQRRPEIVKTLGLLAVVDCIAVLYCAGVLLVHGLHSPDFWVAVVSALGLFGVSGVIFLSSAKAFIVRIADRQVQFPNGVLSTHTRSTYAIEAIERFELAIPGGSTALELPSSATCVVNARFADGKFLTLTLGSNAAHQLEAYVEELNHALSEGKRFSNGYRD
jgi:hypothetical protein